jgi:hypothetical protein
MEFPFGRGDQIVGSDRVVFNTFPFDVISSIRYKDGKHKWRKTMISRQRLESRIRQKEQEIQSLELSIREAKSYLQALQDMLKMLPKDGNARDTLRHGSDLAKARDAIRAAARPLHISAILSAIGKENSKKNRVSLGGSLSGYVRKEAIFTKPAPNTFGLVDLPDGNAAVPPDEFGKT